MPSNYPAGLDELTDGVGQPTDPLQTGHVGHHAAVGEAVEAVQAELGVDPAGASATVADRFGTVLPLAGGTMAGAVAMQGPVYDVRAYGAVGDGVVDDRAAFAAALAAADAAGGAQVVVPARKYRINTDGGSLTIGEGVAVVGLGGYAWRDPAVAADGPMIYVTGTTNSPFIVERGARVENLNFYWPDQPLNTSTPTAYPPCFRATAASGSRSEFKNLRFLNCYHGWEVGSEAGTAGGAFYLSGIRGFFFRTFFKQRESAATSIIHDIVVSPLFLPLSGSLSSQYANQNLVLFDVGESDGLTVSNAMLFRAWTMIAMHGNEYLNFARFTNVTCDGVVHGFTTDGTGGVLSLQFANCFFAMRDIDAPAMAETAFDFTFTKTGLDQRVSFTGCRFRDCSGAVINVGGGELDRLTVENSAFYQWARGTGNTGDVAAIKVNNAGVAVRVTDCDFDAGGYATAQAVDLPSFSRAVVTENDAVGCDKAFTFGSGGALTFTDNRTRTSSVVGGQITGTVTKAVWAGNDLDIAPATAKHTRPAFRARVNAAQVFGSSALRVQYSVELEDKGGDYDPTTNWEFTAPIPGSYAVAARLSYAAAGLVVGDTYLFRIQVALAASGTENYDTIHPIHTVVGGSLRLSEVLELARGDKVYVVCQRLSGTGSMTSENNQNRNRFSGRLVE